VPVQSGTRSAAVAAPLVAAVAGCVVLVALSVTLPVYTVPNGEAGPQPRVALVSHFGWRGAVPAVGLLGAAVLVAAVLRWGRTPVRRGAVVAARGLAGLVLGAAFVSVVAFHVVALLAVPVGALLLVAAFTVDAPGRGNAP